MINEFGKLIEEAVGKEVLDELAEQSRRETFEKADKVVAEMNEADPNGLDQHAGGAKNDAGKIRTGMVLRGFDLALHEVARVGTLGANKYATFGFLDVPNGFNRYTDAMQRHFLAEDRYGMGFDPDFKDLYGEDIYHAAQVAWNALARFQLMLLESASDHIKEVDKGNDPKASK